MSRVSASQDPGGSPGFPRPAVSASSLHSAHLPPDADLERWGTARPPLCNTPPETPICSMFAWTPGLHLILLHLTTGLNTNVHLLCTLSPLGLGDSVFPDSPSHFPVSFLPSHF